MANDHFCKKLSQTEKEKRKWQKTYPDCPTCGKTNHPAEKCWKGAGAHLRLKRTRPDDKTKDASGDQKTSEKVSNSEPTTSGQSSFTNLDSKNQL